MARPRLNNTLGDTMATVGSVKQIIRVISKNNMEDPVAGYFLGSTIDAYLGEFYAQGYELFNTHFLGSVPEGHMVLYILVKKV